MDDLTAAQYTWLEMIAIVYGAIMAFAGGIAGFAIGYAAAQ